MDKNNEFLMMVTPNTTQSTIVENLSGITPILPDKWQGNLSQLPEKHLDTLVKQAARLNKESEKAFEKDEVTQKSTCLEKCHIKIISLFTEARLLDTMIALYTIQCKSTLINFTKLTSNTPYLVKSHTSEILKCHLRWGCRCG